MEQFKKQGGILPPLRLVVFGGSSGLPVQEEKIKDLKTQNKMLAHEKWLLEREKTELTVQIEKLKKSEQVKTAVLQQHS